MLVLPTIGQGVGKEQRLDLLLACGCQSRTPRGPVQLRPLISACRLQSRRRAHPSLRHRSSSCASKEREGPTLIRGARSCWLQIGRVAVTQRAAARARVHGRLHLLRMRRRHQQPRRLRAAVEAAPACTESSHMIQRSPAEPPADVLVSKVPLHWV